MIKVYTQLGCYEIINFRPNSVYKILSTKLEGMKLPNAEWSKSHTNLSAFYSNSLLNHQQPENAVPFITPMGGGLWNDKCQMYSLGTKVLKLQPNSPE